MSKNSIIVIIALFVLIVGTLAIQLYKVEKQTPARDYLQSQQDSLMREIRRTQRLVHDLKVELSLHQDTIKMIEKQTPARDYLQSQQDSLMREIRRTQRLVHDLKVELSLHQDTIKMIEKQIPIIKNNYYTNEKVYLSSSDSVNHAIRLRNQYQFEQDYFSGRFSPKTR
jgi:hypothetical protein